MYFKIKSERIRSIIGLPKINNKELKSGAHILITNNTLSGRAGTEMYVRDIALALLKRGYNPIAYSSILGDVANELRSLTVPVIDNLESLNVVPDLIHGQHHIDAVTAMMRFPQVPALFICHGWLPWEETPPIIPSIVLYIAVDDLNRERLLTMHGIQPQKIKTLYNFVDTERFLPRSTLPQIPSSALIFSNTASKDNFSQIISHACQKYGINKIDIVGMNSGNSIAQPEQLLSNYDIVFAKGRCALEAMATGCAVIIADYYGIGGMVTTSNMAAMRCLNFGVRTMQKMAITKDNIYTELTHYNNIDAVAVSEWIRKEANLEQYMDVLINCYKEVVNETITVTEISKEQWFSKVSNYFRSITPVIKLREDTIKLAIASECIKNIHSIENTFTFSSAIFDNDLMELKLASFQPLLGDRLVAANIDNIILIKNELHIIGWVCDGYGGQGCTAVMAIVNNQVIGIVYVDISRPDVQKALKLINNRAGFKLILNSIPQSIVKLVAITVDGRIFKFAERQFN